MKKKCSRTLNTNAKLLVEQAINENQKSNRGRNMGNSLSSFHEKIYLEITYCKSKKFSKRKKLKSKSKGKSEQKEWKKQWAISDNI